MTDGDDVDFWPLMIEYDWRLTVEVLMNWCSDVLLDCWLLIDDEWLLWWALLFDDEDCWIAVFMIDVSKWLMIDDWWTDEWCMMIWIDYDVLDSDDAELKLIKGCWWWLMNDDWFWCMCWLMTEWLTMTDWWYMSLDDELMTKMLAAWWCFMYWCTCVLM